MKFAEKIAEVDPWISNDEILLILK